MANFKNPFNDGAFVGGSIPASFNSPSRRDLNREVFPELVGRYFLTIPADLLELLETDKKLSQLICLERERALTAAAADVMGDTIGFRDGEPLRGQWLNRPWGVKKHRKAAKLKPNFEVSADIYSSFAPPADPSALAYLGWLITSPEFIEDLTDLKARCPWVFSPAYAGPPRDAAPLPEEALQHWGEECRGRWNDEGAYGLFELRTKWRLESLTSPWTANPKRIRHVRHSEASNAEQHFIEVPDIADVPDPAQMRLLVERILLTVRGRGSHLDEWFQIASFETPGARALERFGIVYQYAHLERVLQSRYSKQLDGNRGRLDEVFSKLFDVTPRTVGNARRLITSRLGHRWMHSQF